MIDGETRYLAILGQPVADSLSPVMQNAAFAAAGLSWHYLACAVDAVRLPRAIRGAEALGMVGLNVTAPHKGAAAAEVDRLVGVAERLALVNTILFGPEGCSGHSTDGAGLLDALRDQGVTAVAGAQAVVLGAGGAGVSVAAALLAAGATVVLLNRTASRLEQALVRLRQSAAGESGETSARLLLSGHVFADPEVRDVIGAADLIVNSVPARLGPPPVELAALRPAVVTCDLSYGPHETPFNGAAVAAGARHVGDGRGMLVHQGARSFTLWTGRPAPVQAMAAAVGYRLPD